MNDQRFKYDVAFSFLKDDEGLATRVNDLLSGRLRTFIYSRQQDVVAGTNGEDVFNRVFGHEARIVVVLYRTGWGSTPFTRFEETAIRNRAYEEGYDFALFVPLDRPPTVPQWLPKNRIWIGLDRWGEQSVAVVIEARVQEAGGELRQETSQQTAARLARDLAFANRREQFLNSEAGVNAANVEADNLISALESLVTSTQDLNLVFEREPRRRCAISLDNFSILIIWDSRIINNLQDARLYVHLFEQKFPLHRAANFDELHPVRTWRFRFDVGQDESRGWREEGTDMPLVSTADAADLIVRRLLDRVRERRLDAPARRFQMLILPSQTDR